MAGESARRLLRHVIRTVHATTGDAVAVRAEFAERPPHGWALRVASGRILVSAQDASSQGPAVLVTALAVRLAEPVALVELTAPQIEHRFEPLPSVLEVRLAGPEGPGAGRTVTAHPSSGPPLTLREEETGVYRSPPTAWSEHFAPFELRVDTVLVRRAFLDVTGPTTRIRLVDPT